MGYDLSLVRPRRAVRAACLRALIRYMYLFQADDRMNGSASPDICTEASRMDLPSPVRSSSITSVCLEIVSIVSPSFFLSILDRSIYALAMLYVLIQP